MKAILILDKPKCCADCRFKDSATNYMLNEIDFFCHATEDVIICDIDNEIDSSCPLKPMPENDFIDEAESYETEDEYKAYIHGFNDCIAEILEENK